MRGPDAIGMTIGERYALQKQLGGGGLGAVYLAHDQERDCPVVIKSVHAPDERSRALLMREARLLSTIGARSSGVVAYLDLVLDRGELYLVTEYIRGEPLSAWQARPHEPHEILALYADMARVLGEVHAAGAVHRDLKPSNVMVVEEEGEEARVVLIDFGLAVSTEEEDTLTGVGTFVGTLAYMNPEVAQGLEATPASDVFSLGLMLVEALTGNLPWSVSPGAFAAYVQAVLTSPPDLRHLLDSKLRDLLGAMLAKNPAARPPAADVASALGARARSGAPALLYGTTETREPSAGGRDVTAKVGPTPEERGSANGIADFSGVAAQAPPPPYLEEAAKPRIWRRLGTWLTGDAAVARGVRIAVPVALVAGLVAGLVVALVRFAGIGARAYATVLPWALVPLASAALLGLGLLRRRRELQAAGAPAMSRGLEARLRAIEERLEQMGHVSGAIALDIDQIKQIKPQLDEDRLAELVRRSVLFAISELQVGAGAGDVGKAIEALASLAQNDGPPPWHKRLSTWLTVGGLFVGLAGGGLGLVSSAGLWKPNAAPAIRAITTDKERATRAAPIEVRVDAADPEGDALTYAYEASTGHITSEGPLALWQPDAASPAALVRIEVAVSDGKSRARQSKTIRINRRPRLAIAAPAGAGPGATIRLSANGEPDPDGDALTYRWHASQGEIRAGAGGQAELVAPAQAGIVQVRCTVSDGWETWALDSAAIDIQ